MFTFLSWHGNYENMELPQLSIHRVEYYHWQDQIGRQTKTELIFISLHYFVTSQYFSKWFFSSSKNKPLVRLIQSHTWFAVRQKKKKKIVLNMPKWYVYVIIFNKCSVIETICQFGQHILDTYSTHLGWLCHTNMSEFRI